MLRIRLNPAEHEIELAAGVTVTVLPFTTALMASVQADLAEARLPQDLRGPEMIFRLGLAVAKRAITGWSGVFDEEDRPLEPTPEAIEGLMQVYQIHEAFYTRYIAPRLVLNDEKKG